MEAGVVAELVDTGQVNLTGVSGQLIGNISFPF